MMIRILFIFLSLSYSLLSQANVDPESGSFSHKFYDFTDSGTQYNFTRSYKSQNHDKSGLFGKGWCSPIEDKLIIYNKRHLALDSCEFGFIPFLKKGDLWMSTLGGLTVRKKHYHISFGSQVMTFDKKGLLTKIEKDQQLTLRLKYEKNKIKNLYIHHSIYSFKYHGENITIHSGDEKVASYNISDELLTSYINDWGNTYSLSYKKNGPLQKLSVNKDPVLSLTYSSLNLVTSISNSVSDCRWKIKYNHKNRLSYGAQINKKCANNNIEISNYNFSYRKRKGQYSLSSVTYEGPRQDKVTREVAMDKETLRSKKGEMVVSKDKYQRTTRILNNNISISYKYGKSHLAKPTKVILKNNKNKKEVSFEYQYKKNGLIGIITKNGTPHLEIKYDLRGKFNKISKGDKTIAFTKEADVFKFLEKNKKIKDLYSTHYGVSKILQDLKVATAPLKYGGPY